MARAPFTVLVLPFRRTTTGMLEYAIFRRADLHFWQPIAGGGEGDETPLAAARREAWEEAGIPTSAAYYALTTQASIRVSEIHPSARTHWPPRLYVIPMSMFAVAADGIAIRLSREHTSVRWMRYEQAARRLRWDSDRTALWELNERLAHNDLLPASDG